jgi:selenocysteine lyase/cysteine desulfurase
MEPLASFRSDFEVAAEGYAYLNHAAVSPLPRRSRQRIEAYLDELTRHGAARYPGTVFATLERVRALGATLLGTRPEQVFIVRSTTQGIGIAATGIPLAPGDNVVLVEREFPANLRPWLPLRRRGVELRMVAQREGRVPLESLAAALDARTRALSLSFVQFLSGFRIDLAAVGELLRRRAPDALFVVDAIQGLGVFPVEVEACGVDFLSADAHKWLLGPEGVGLGYASPRALERIVAALEGWLSVESPFDFFDLAQPLKASAARFEEGAYNLAGIHGLLGSLELLAEATPAVVERRVLELGDTLCAGLARIGWRVLSPRATPGERSGIVLADREAPLVLGRLRDRLREARVEVSIRDGALRAAPHAYNTEEELERLLEVLRAS